eukprot:GSChrysophyteH1.ASY1.ANO1.485.1 assembled CDS
MLSLSRSAARVVRHRNILRCSTRMESTTTRIGDVEITTVGSGREDLVPRGYLEQLSPMPEEVRSHFRWLAQKFELRQDSLILGHPGPFRRQLVFAFAEACGLEVEYLRLTRDTTESDLKQRKELSSRGANGQSVEFHDQAPVRAALHGRLLVIEGLEAAERNVLPTLNNLLENREMQLEEGCLLGSPVKPVHQQFRVIALALQSPPYSGGNALDPPLRSRFQSRFVDVPSAEATMTLLDPSAEQLQMRYCLLSGPENTPLVHRDLAGGHSLSGSSQESIIGAEDSSQLTREQQVTLARLERDAQNGRHLCVLGPRGCGKSTLARELASRLSLKSTTFPMYADLTARDLLQRRHTDPQGNTSWQDTPLISAARFGELCVLDGIDRADPNTLVALQSLLHDGIVPLPSGELLRAHSRFRVAALGQFHAGHERADDMQRRYVSSELDWNYHLVPKMSQTDMFHVLEKENLALQGFEAEKLKQITYHLNLANVPELALHLRHLLRIQRLCRNSEDFDGTLRAVLSDSLMVRFLPRNTREKFSKALHDSGVADAEMLSVVRTPIDPNRVPSPLFYENEQHTQTLQSMLKSIVRGERSLLLVGNQGVGKNKLADRLLELLRAERDYVQLHRDSTIQSLTLTPSLEGGRIFYQPSAVVQAALAGRVLVVDEADKAPLEVVTVLKGLAEDGELMLPDGRRLLHRNVWGQHYPEEANVLLVHPDFRLMVLANRPGMPFLGNNFFRECGDVFHTFVIDNLPLASELELLRAYGPDVPSGVLQRLAEAFSALRDAHEKGELSYPYSAREAVAVVKHIQKYPTDGALVAIENILQFENLTPSTRAKVASIFQKKGVPVPAEAGAAANRPPVRLATSVDSPLPQKSMVHGYHGIRPSGYAAVIIPDLSMGILIPPSKKVPTMVPLPDLKNFLESKGSMEPVRSAYSASMPGSCVLWRPGGQRLVLLNLVDRTMQFANLTGVQEKGGIHSLAFMEGHLLLRTRDDMSLVLKTDNDCSILWPRANLTSETAEPQSTTDGLTVMRSIPAGAVVHSLISKPVQGRPYLEVVEKGSDEDPLKLRRINFKSLDDSEIGNVLDMSVLAEDRIVAVLFSNGLVRMYETEEASLQRSLATWQVMHVNTLPLDRNGRFADQPSKPKTGLDAPKHGKEDPHNKPHIGGNTWAGGTGGSDTAGLGGRGGLQKRLEEISLGKGAFDAYLEYRNRVRAEIASLQTLMDEIARRAKERIWLRRQSHGELDDTRLIDGLTGDRLVFKRRGTPDSHGGGHKRHSNAGSPTQKRLQFVVDVSGSMYRFNGQDRRLERMLESVLLVLESLPTDEQSPVQYSLTGHSGDSPDIPFLEFSEKKPADEAAKYQVMEKLVAHSQYCLSGDYTVRAIDIAIDKIMEEGDDDGTERYVFVLSDANFERYGITPELVQRVMLKESNVNVHLILIASLGGEAEQIVQAMSRCEGKVHTCFDTSKLPSIFQKILLDAIGEGADVV